MDKKEYWVLSFSGGKDSTALGLEWLKRHQTDPVNYPFDEVIYCDTGLEFPQMVEHINLLESLFTDAGIKFTRLKSEKTFEYYMFDYMPKYRRNPDNHEQGYGWPCPSNRWCTSRLKIEVIDGYLKRLRAQYDLVRLIGLAADEGYRAERKINKNLGHRHPLMDWGWTELDCLKYCYDHGFNWGGLYELFGRVSCWCCPLQSLHELRQLRVNFPDLWEKLLAMDSRSWQKFRSDYSVEQLESRFQFEEECLAKGKSIKTREFYKELKARIGKEELL